MSTTASSTTSEPRALPPLKPPTKIALNPPSIQKISFFGTSSAVPQPGRANVSSLAIGLSSGAQILVDCGEATQHQLMLSQSLTMGKIDTILITHLHGDHFFGIFGLLASLGTLSRTSPLTVVGPKGLKNAIDAVFNTEVNQTTPVNNHNDATTTNENNETNDKNTNDANNNNNNNTNTPLTDDADHAYQLKIIEVPTDIPTLLGSLDRGDDPNHPFTLGSNPGVDIMCVPIEHRVPCVGYVIYERSKVGRIDSKKALSLGAKPKDMTSLKSGQDLILADGSIVYSKDVCDPAKEGKSIAIVQDTHDPTKFGNYFNNVDAMIHECTFDDELYAKSIDHGHSTPSMAANFAFAKNVKDLFLTHFSSRYEKEYPCLDLDGTTIFSPATLHDYVPRQLLCQLKPEELAALKNEINNNNPTQNTNKKKNNTTTTTTTTTPPQTPSKQSQSQSEQQSTITPKEHFTNQMNDSTIDDICCGAGDDHHHDNEQSSQQQQDDISSTQQTLKRQRIDPQILAYQRDMPFYTQIRTNDYGIASSVQDLKAQAQFCVEQLWISHNNSLLTNISSTVNDESLIDDGTSTITNNSIPTNTNPLDNDVISTPNNIIENTSTAMTDDVNPSVVSDKKDNNKNDNKKVEIKEDLTTQQITQEITQLPQPIPSIDSLLSMHQRAINMGTESIEGNVQNKTKVWVGCDFRVFDYNSKQSQWSQGIIPDIDLQKYTAFKQRDKGKPAPLF